MAVQPEFHEALGRLLSIPPLSYALIRGSEKYPQIAGTVYFYPLWAGSLVMAEVMGLPAKGGACAETVHGFHIHEGSRCLGTEEDPFSMAGSHYNPTDCPHPEHAGDLPPLFANNGYALSLFYTNRFHPLEVVGRTVIVHDMPDDFRTQPSGDSGMKIACGEIFANEFPESR